MNFLHCLRHHIKANLFAENLPVTGCGWLAGPDLFSQKVSGVWVVCWCLAPATIIHNPQPHSQNQVEWNQPSAWLPPISPLCLEFWLQCHGEWASDNTSQKYHFFYKSLTFQFPLCVVWVIRYILFVMIVSFGNRSWDPYNETHVGGCPTMMSWVFV